MRKAEQWGSLNTEPATDFNTHYHEAAQACPAELGELSSGSLHPRCGAAGTRVGRCGPCLAVAAEAHELDGLSAPTSSDLDGKHDEAAPWGAQELWASALP